MTEREICEKIVKQGNCDDIRCGICQLKDSDDKCFSRINQKTVVENAKQWLEDHPKKEEFQKGEIILVRDNDNEEWRERIYIEGNCCMSYIGEFCDHPAKEIYLSGNYGLCSWQQLKKLNGEIVTANPKKALITDKMIYDIIDSSHANIAPCMPNIKKLLIEKGYEVEKPKSKLEEAREIKIDYNHYMNVDNEINVKKKINLYEESIKELQEEIEQLKKGKA